MVTLRLRVGPVLYGVLWALVAPALLLGWAVATEPLVPLPPLHAPLAGGLLAAVGLLLMAAGMTALAVDGGGLPMNAYPPPRLVVTGVYRLTPHPIYVGFVLIAFGASLVSGSASGLWLVAPAAALALTALVLGYERHDLRQRLGEPRTARLSLPRRGDGTPTGWERASVYVLVLLPWLLLYEAVHYAGVPRDAVASHLPFERGWPVLEWTEAVYASAYVMILATPLLVRSRAALRQFAVTGLLATALVTFVYILVPLVAPPRPFEPTTVLGRVLAYERSLSHTVAAFPAFHVIWPLIASVAWRMNGRGWGAVARIWTLLIAASCITTGMHSLLDVAAAFAIWPLLSGAERVRETLRRGAERIANSWHEWHVGPVRLINHGFYTAAGGALGLWIAGAWAGPALVVPVALVALFSLGVSAVWAQFVEGSPALLRPLGFYGGIAGGLLAFIALAAFGIDVIAVILGFGLAMPWVQAAGRLRCLVQGCCHGGPAPASIGIRYMHPRSRVTQIAVLSGVPLHPTPLYSIIANVVIGLFLLRLQMLGAAAGLVIGAYFMLNSLARFVEEAYRAEPQTPVVARLRLYQWLALGTFGLGIGFTVIAPRPIPAGGGFLEPRLLLASLVVGAVALFITGVDFPRSGRRFSRLAAVDSTSLPVAPRQRADAVLAAKAATDAAPRDAVIG
jgi:protein-S-isoprenylcysteine O-methyltransferase Ste14